MTRMAMVFSILVAAGSLAWGYSISEFPEVSTWLLAAGAIWLLGEWRRFRWSAPLILLIFISSAGFGLWFGLPASLMVVGAVAGLLGWDLSSFAERLRFAAPSDDLRGLEMRHLGRVAIVAALGLLLAGISAIIKVRIPFEVAVALSLLGTIGLTRLVFWIQRGNNL